MRFCCTKVQSVIYIFVTLLTYYIHLIEHCFNYVDIVMIYFLHRIFVVDGCRVVMVVGAGRGPLVRASLEAAKKADRKIKVFAVEKNPNAVIT